MQAAKTDSELGCLNFLG